MTVSKEDSGGDIKKDDEDADAKTGVGEGKIPEKEKGEDEKVTPAKQRMNSAKQSTPKSGTMDPPKAKPRAGKRKIQDTLAEDEGKKKKVSKKNNKKKAEKKNEVEGFVFSDTLLEGFDATEIDFSSTQIESLSDTLILKTTKRYMNLIIRIMTMRRKRRKEKLWRRRVVETQNLMMTRTT